MSYFNKVVAYIDLFEKEEKRKNVGFVKIIQKDDICKIQITIKGLKPSDTMQCTMQEMASGKLLDELSIMGGQGNYRREFPSEKIGKSEIPVEQIQGIQITFSNDRYGIAKWKETTKGTLAEDSKETKSEPAAEIEFENEMKQSPQIKEHDESQKETENGAKGRDQIEVEDEIIEIVQTEIAQTETENSEDNKSEIVVKDIQEHGNRVVPESVIHSVENLEVDKWQQLCQIYPMVHPFEHGNGEYLSIEPKDFVILQNKYQSLVNNSFLLHGFYNYRHIILGKKEEGSKDVYYIGVPGNYYSREKTVAVMFGFEAFESTKKDRTGRDSWCIENIEQGTYGYYLCRVEL